MKIKHGNILAHVFKGADLVERRFKMQNNDTTNYTVYYSFTSFIIQSPHNAFYPMTVLSIGHHFLLER